MGKKWLMDLEVIDGEDEFFQTLDYSNQHTVLKRFILDVLHANGFDSRIRLNKYEESYDSEEFDEWHGTEAPKNIK